MTTVLADTTTTFVDVMMSGTPWMQLLTLCGRGDIALIVPEVVLRETARHWRTKGEDAHKLEEEGHSRVLRSRRHFDYLGVQPRLDPLPSLPVAELDADAFYDQAYARLAPLGVTVAPLPNVTVAAILARDLAGKKPFEKSGKGFRDALVWENVKETLVDLSKDDTLYLVTNNTNDYCLDGELHPDLASEIKDVKAELRQVNTLDDLLEQPEFAGPVASLAKTDEDLAMYLKSISSEPEAEYTGLSVGEIVKHALILSAESLVDEDIEAENETTSGLDFTNLQIPREIEGTSISWIDVHEETAQWQAYETFEGGTLLIRGEIDADVTVQGFVYKSDYVAVESEVELVDWEWNDHMAQVVTTKAARLIFQVRADVGSNFVDDCEFEGVEPLDDIADDAHHAG